MLSDDVGIFCWYTSRCSVDVVAPTNGRRVAIVGRRGDERSDLDAISVELACDWIIAWGNFWYVSSRISFA